MRKLRANNCFLHFFKLLQIAVNSVLFSCPVIVRVGGGASGSSAYPSYTFTGISQLLDEGDGNWKIKILSSGTFKAKKTYTLDVFCGGAGGGSGTGYAGGAGGGYTNTTDNVVVVSGNEYTIVIGAGGVSTGTDGGNTSAFGAVANGGKANAGVAGGAGGSGGGGYGQYLGAGGTDGGNGANGVNAQGTVQGVGGTGQGTTTREFGESTGTLYANGGKGLYGTSYADKADNSCDGADMGGHAGGSGIVVIRNHRSAA